MSRDGHSWRPIDSAWLAGTGRRAFAGALDCLLGPLRVCPGQLIPVLGPHVLTAGSVLCILSTAQVGQDEFSSEVKG